MDFPYSDDRSASPTRQYMAGRPFPGLRHHLPETPGTASPSDPGMSQQSSPISFPFLNRPTFSAGTPYKTARAVPPTGFLRTAASSARFFEDTISSVMTGATQEGHHNNNASVDEFSDLSDTIPTGETDEKSQEAAAAVAAAATGVSPTIDEVVSNIFNEKKDEDPSWKKHNKLIVGSVLVVLLIFLACAITVSSFPVFTCNNADSVCLAPLSIRLTDKTESAKTALQTVREALKVLTYVVIDFGDTHGDLDQMNSRMDEYYQTKVIDSFNVNTVYELNLWGYCRTSENGARFCMRSYGFDLISVFVRDAGVQLGDLTRTNIGIMGDSFAMLYELCITGFSEMVMREGDGSEYVDHAILLQKFSKGMGFMSVTQLAVNGFLFGLTATLLALVSIPKADTATILRARRLKRYLVVSMLCSSFLGVTASFVVLSFTQQFCAKLTQLNSAIGIADVTVNTGLYLLWALLAVQIVVCGLIVYVANCYRKHMV